MRYGVDLAPFEFLEAEHTIIAEDDDRVVVALRVEKKWLARNMFLLTYLFNRAMDQPQELWPELTRGDNPRRLKPWNDDTGFGSEKPPYSSQRPSKRKAPAKRPRRAPRKPRTLSRRKRHHG